MNQYCGCDYCNHGDMPIDDEMTLEMRLDIAEAALKGLRRHIIEIDLRLQDVYDWAKRTDRQIVDNMKRDLERRRNHD